MKKLMMVLMLGVLLGAPAFAGERNPKSDDLKMAEAVMHILNKASNLDEAYTEAIVWVFDDGEKSLQLFASSELQSTLKKLDKSGRNEVLKKLTKDKVRHYIDFANQVLDISELKSVIITESDGTIIAYAKL